MGQNTSICRGQESDASSRKCRTIEIPCNIYGRYSCFVCIKQGYALYETIKDEICQVKGENGLIQDVPFKAILDEMGKLGVCLKVFRLDSIKEYEKEIGKTRTLKNVLGDELFESHTTYIPVLGMLGAKFVFKSNIIKIENELTNVIHAMFHQECVTNLDNMEVKHNAMKIYNDVIPIIQRIHNAGYYHLDIYHKNIVYCKQNNLYKLIDFGMFRKDMIDSTIFESLKFNGLLRRETNIDEWETNIVEVYRDVYEQLDKKYKNKDINVDLFLKFSDYYDLFLTLWASGAYDQKLMYQRFYRDQPYLQQTIGGGKLENLTVKELRQRCSKRHIPYSGKRKAELIAALRAPSNPHRAPGSKKDARPQRI